MSRLRRCVSLVCLMAPALPAGVAYPERAPDVPVIDEAFLRDRIPTSALTAQRGTTLPAVAWDRDGDGFIELTATWDPEAEEFTSWTCHDPQTQRPLWRLEVADYRESPWKLVWDADGDGLMDFTALDADRDHRPHEILWQVTADHPQMARFLDRDEDGVFEARCWIDLTEITSPRQGGRTWSFDDDGDGEYERFANGDEVTENGYLPASAEAILTRDPHREDLRWDMIEWCRSSEDVDGFRRHVLAYVEIPEGRRIFRLTLEPLMKRAFYTDAEFRSQVIASLRQRAEQPTAGFVTLWTLAELLRWQAAPPMVHPLLRPQWLAKIGLESEAGIPREIDLEAAAESELWFRRALASEHITNAARESVAFNLAMLCAARGDWEAVDTLCLALVNQSIAAFGPDSAQCLQLADIFFSYGNRARARLMYDSVVSHWQSNPGDPARAQPNHLALNRLGLMAYADGDVGQARYYLMRALDSMTPEVHAPETELATLLLGSEESRDAADEYLEVALARLAEGAQ